jgi:hypothetical protein
MLMHVACHLEEVERLQRAFPVGRVWWKACLFQSVVQRISKRKRGTDCDEVKKEQVMSDFKDKAREKIDAAANVAKRATDKVVDKSRGAVHTAGKGLEKQGKRLQNA